MKSRFISLIALAAILLTACNMTLAQDITPPPGSFQQSQPTHAPVYPAEAPDIQNGAVLYIEKCAPCHGEKGLSDGKMSSQLTSQGINVPLLGLPETARKTSPADWFLFVTLGNMEKFMPSFNSLSDQERWDVVAYARSLSVTPQQIKLGETLYADACASCHSEQPEIISLSRLSQLSWDAMDTVIATGIENKMPGFPDFSVEERAALAAYLQASTFGAITTDLAAGMSTPAATLSASTPDGDISGTPAATETPLKSGDPTAAPADEETTPEAAITPDGFGSINGKVTNGSGGALPSGLVVTLRGFDHSMEENANPQEVINKSTETGKDNSFRFDNVEMPEGRIFFAEVNYLGISFQSDLAFTEAGVTELSLSDVAVYENTTETGGLVIDDLFVFTEFNSDGTVRVFEQFYITNQGSQAVTVETDGTFIPFLPVPEGVSGLAFQTTQDSAPLLSLENGFAIPPSSERYGIIAFFSIPYEKKLELSMPFALPVSKASVVVPEGITAEGKQLTDDGIKEMQPGARFQVYSVGAIQGGESMDMTLSGKVKSAPSESDANTNQSLLIGVGAFGVVLILAGIWMFIRDRNKENDEMMEESNDEFETAEEVMDAIIALDDLHRAGKIPDAAYQERREELKERLKDLA